MAKGSNLPNAGSGDIEKACSRLFKFESSNGDDEIKDLFRDLKRAATALLIVRNEKALKRLHKDLQLLKEKLYSRKYQSTNRIEQLENVQVYSVNLDFIKAFNILVISSPIDLSSFSVLLSIHCNLVNPKT